MQKLFKDLPQNDMIRKKVKVPDFASIYALVCDWLEQIHNSTISNSLFCTGGPSESTGI